MPSPFFTRPWQRVAIDTLKSHGKYFLLITDYYSRYPEVFSISSFTSENMINFCKAAFSRHGIPEEVISDNPFNSALFRKFARDYGFIHTTSSPRYPQSNGFVEAGVKIVKSLLSKNVDWYKGLLEYRASPLANGLSPAELLFGRRIRTSIPMHPQLLQPKPVDKDLLRGKEQQRVQLQKADYDRHHLVTSKDEFKSGDVVWVKDLKLGAQVSEKADTPRSYIIETPRGKFRRNSHHLTPAHTEEIPELQEIPTADLSEGVESRRLSLSTPEASPSPGTSQNVPSPSSAKTRSGRTVKPPMRLIETM
jgi:hypothetical protein